MANFDALFAGCESFMEGDVEINNDVTVPAANDAEAIEAETVAEDVGAEGGELAGESETEEAKTEAANMVFDQLMNMYTHVKQYGIDRTFLSLYNSNGQLNQMIGYKFPSCESIDSVGSPRSNASRAFIAAMEDEGVFKKIWNWIKETCKKIYKFFVNLMDWFREAFGNMDLRIGKLRKFFGSTNTINKDPKDQESVSIIYYTKAKLQKYSEALTKYYDVKIAETQGIDGSISGRFGLSKTGDVAAVAASIGTAMEKYTTELRTNISNLSAKTGSGNYGSDRKEGENNELPQVKRFVDNIKKDIIEPLKDAAKELASDSDQLSRIGSDNYISVTGGHKELKGGVQGKSAGGVDAKSAANSTLAAAAEISSTALSLRQHMDTIKDAAKKIEQSAQQQEQQTTGHSMYYDSAKNSRLATTIVMKVTSILAMQASIYDVVVRRLVKQAASLQKLTKSNED